MAGSYYPTTQDLTPSPQELKRQRDAAQAPGTDQAWGSGIGSVLGGAAGLGLSALLAPTGAGLVAAPELIGAGAALGGGLGGAIGGSIGNAQANQDSSMVDAAELERNKKLMAFQIRQEALNRLESM